MPSLLNINLKPYRPQVDDTSVKTKFIWFPRVLPNIENQLQLRWLGFEPILYQYERIWLHDNAGFTLRWRAKRWVN